MEDGTKVCSVCGGRKPLAEFHVRRAPGGGSRWDPRCKPCDHAQKREWRLNNPEKVAEIQQRFREKHRKPKRVSALVTGVKVCSRCGEEKGIDAFPRKPQGRDGLNAACRPCLGVASRKRYLEHREDELARGRMRSQRDREKIREYSRHYRMLRRFNLTVDGWEALFESQGRTCAVCGRSDPDGPHWHTDHCHSTGKVRGILCRRCNLGLGWFDDSPEKMGLAARYVQRHS